MTLAGGKPDMQPHRASLLTGADMLGGILHKGLFRPRTERKRAPVLCRDPTPTYMQNESASLAPTELHSGKYKRMHSTTL
eukprot:CAMPEP_0203892562 /NCGR_PEP_ID=MMETSP0359-20131031/35738_1 /ASSEMBLY_ACC=CAM_ASM_000338 /TAXON_ID=268821 /ORGANISM="Scrippsiella Hangoei, Strain SHTV-5" /LENGTH=79 /DNA_ID=CAMNT_0050814549 /DNA_START=9 /DNA_END=247 /DNA_ORIENTATION=+